MELAAVLLVLGLVVWLAAPRIAALTGRSRDAAFREIAAASETAFDTALFEKREVRLVLDPAGGTFRFLVPAREGTPPEPRSIGAGLRIAGIRIEGEDRPPDTVTVIPYLPGGRVPETRIYIREEIPGGRTAEWTLRINPVDGSVDVIEGIEAGTRPLLSSSSRRFGWTSTSS